MALQPPRRLLEITIISAQDLPPVSKMLLTFAVAYLHPENKLTTRIDHSGHTNPTWNYKVSFHIDESFLTSNSMAITFEIYNLAWLRDLPIGTARLFLGNLSPPLHKNPAFRHVSLKVSRPSGHLQGTLILGIQLADVAIPGDKICTSPEKTISERDNEECKLWNAEQERRGLSNNKAAQVPGSKTITVATKASLCTTPDSRGTIRPGSELETRTTVISSNFMSPLPTEVAADIKMGYISTGWNEYGNSIFDNWTEVGENDNKLMRSRSVKGPQWKSDDNDIHLRGDEVENGKRKKGGLFSCFAYGFQISIFCGSKEARKKKRDVNKENVHLMTIPDKNLRGFYV